MNRYRLLVCALLALPGADRVFAATTPAAPDTNVTPAALTFAYQIGNSIPAAQALAIKSTTSAVLSFTVTVTQPASCSAPCIDVSASSGNTPNSLQVYANPTGLAAGAYTGSITINATGATTTSRVVIVTLNVSNAASTLTPSTGSVSFTYTTGTPGIVQSQAVSISTNADALPATVTAAGGNWLKATPGGIIPMAGFPQTVLITTDATGMAPAATPYKGTVTIASSNALNKSVVVNVTLAVSAGVPTITGVWPPGAPAGSVNPVTVTITGANFTSASTAAASIGTVAPTPLTKITVVNSTTMIGTIPATLLAANGTMQIVVTTPTATGPSTSANFTVYDPATPQVWAVVNSASYNQGTVSPGEIVTIYGVGLGPNTITPFSAAPLPATLANTSVTVNALPCPLLYTSATQVSCVVPLTVPTTGPQVDVVLTYNGVQSTARKVNVAAADPGVFTIGSTGQAAVLNVDTTATSTAYSVNSTTNPTHPGSWVAIYLTGFGKTSCTAAPSSPCDTPAPTESQLVGGGVVSPTAPVAVQIGGQAVSAPVAVVPVGSVVGLLQINAQVPASVTAANAVPIVVTIGGVTSTGLATIAVK
jgi:uncharacterized protein (TIGR03437 family)